MVLKQALKLANGLSTFLIKAKLVFSNSPKSARKTPFDCPILWNYVLDNFILADELIAKALRRLRTCVLVNNNLCGNLFLSLMFRVTIAIWWKI